MPDKRVSKNLFNRGWYCRTRAVDRCSRTIPTVGLRERWMGRALC